MSYYPLISLMPKAPPLLLDFFPNAAAAYSLRKLRNGYTGSAIQVRRESDDATQNIAFDLLGELDTSTLLNFVGWNLFAWSEQLQESFWGKSNLTVTPDILVAPDGNMTGDVLFENTTNAAHTFQRNQTLVSGKTYTVSFWIKAQGRNNVRLVTSSGFSQSASNAIAWLNLSSGTIVSQNSGFIGSNLTITADGSWYKVSYTMPSTQTGIVLVLALNPSPDGINTSYIGDPSLGIAVWGLQFTESSTIKPYRQTLAIAEGNGFVTTWYDQSTNGVNVTQPTALYQPRIVNAGVIEVENGKNALNWYSTAQFFNGGNILGLDNKSLQIYVVARNTVTSNRAQLVSKSVSTGDTNRYGLATGGAAGTSMFVHTTTNEYTANSNVADANQRLFNGNYLINNEVRALVNNLSVADLSSPNGTVQNFSRRFLIGATNNTTNNGEIAYFRGTIQEVILYIAPTVDLPSLSNVNTNINSFYTIY